jgi:uncharacterized protein (DUF2235 family)
MPKRIVVCSDGTGNTAIKGRGTNVFKLFEAVDLDSHRFNPDVTTQIAIYDDGVGTEQFKPLKIFGGATGWGLSRNVKHLYKELARVYDPGDEIYMFGFSRGAFTIRTLVGFIATCGLVDPEKLNPKTFGNLQSTVAKAYRAYRKCYRPWLWRLFAQPSKNAGEQFKKAHSASGDVKVRFVGVWDTVDAVGLPFHLSDVLNATIYQFKFPDHGLSPIVQRACHALAIDDQRQSFHPLMWKESPDDQARVTQVWFAGAHSNVGGGYPKQGMSLVALDWLLTQAEQAGAPFGERGLRLNAIERQSFREHSSVDDKLYDPRAGLGIFYRWKIRDIDAMCTANGVKPKLHVSVLERVAHGTDDYSPGNLPARASIVFTAPAKDEHQLLAAHRAASVQKVVKTIPDGTLLNEVRGSMRLGQLAYYAYLASCVAVIVAASSMSAENPLSNPWTAVQATGALAVGISTSPLATVATIARQLIARPGLLVYLTLGFVAAYLMMMYADRQMDQVFSGFWYAKQKELRDNLRLARQEVKAGVAQPAAGVVVWNARLATNADPARHLVPDLAIEAAAS